MTGSQKYLSMYIEPSWGSAGSGTPERVHMPVESYDVRFRQDRRRANPFIGTYQRKHASNYRGMPSGSMVTSLYGAMPVPLTTETTSLAEYLLAWAMESHESESLPSMGMEWAEGPDVSNKLHSGMRVNAATLAGSADSGVIQLSLDLMGKNEVNVVTASTIPADRDNLLEFEFADTVFTFDGNALAIDQFSLGVQHGLSVKYLNSRRPSLLLKTTRIVTFSFTPQKTADTYDALRRSDVDNEYAATLLLKGLQAPGSSTMTTVSIAFPRLSFADADEVGGKDEVSMQTITMDPLKPDSSSKDFTITYGTV